jgi:hypothetical protein
MSASKSRARPAAKRRLPRLADEPDRVQGQGPSVNVLALRLFYIDPPEAVDVTPEG